jgi:hypothetical protein
VKKEDPKEEEVVKSTVVSNKPVEAPKKLVVNDLFKA